MAKTKVESPVVVESKKPEHTHVTSPVTVKKEELRKAGKQEMIQVLRDHCKPEEFEMPRGTEDREEKIAAKIKVVMANYGWEMDQTPSTIYNYYSTAKGNIGWPMQARKKKNNILFQKTVYGTEQTHTLDEALEELLNILAFVEKQFVTLEKAGEFFQVLDKVNIQCGNETENFRERLYKVALFRKETRAAELLKPEEPEELPPPSQDHLIAEQAKKNEEQAHLNPQPVA